MKKAIILAAGKGTRMKSDTFKVLHQIGNRGMIFHILDTLKQIDVDETRLVLSPDMGEIALQVSPIPTVIQEQAKGTAHATLMAAEQVCPFEGACLVIFGDNPLTSAETLQKMYQKCLEGTDVVVLGTYQKDPARNGRLVMGENGLEKIVEYKDATDEEKAINLCNTGAMCINGSYMLSLLKQIKDDNKAKEFYLTDIVKIAKDENLKVDVVIVPNKEVMGVNSRQDLAAAEQVFQEKMRQKALDAGVTLQDPQTTYFSYDTTFESDIVVEPCVYFGKGVHLKKGTHVKAFSRLENITLGD